MLLTVDGGGTAVIDLCDFPELGSFLDIGQQGIPSTSTATRLGLRTLLNKGQKVGIFTPLKYECAFTFFWMYMCVKKQNKKQ